MAVHVVVAKYKEDISWIPPGLCVYVYDKGPDGNIPNVGREAETFARFIVEKYDDLREDDTVYFLQGNPFDHCPDILRVLGTPVTHLTPLGVVYRSDGYGFPEHPGLPIAEKHGMVCACPQKETWDFVAGAQYAVPCTRILAKSHADWRRVHALLQNHTICPWTMERLWPCVF